MLWGDTAILHDGGAKTLKHSARAGRVRNNLMNVISLEAALLCQIQSLQAGRQVDTFKQLQHGGQAV